jgi:Uma2 family endonuclease
VGMNAALPLARYKFSIEDYHRMGETGVLPPDSRVELIEGEVIQMAPIGSLHAGTVSLLTRFFNRNLGEAAVVFTQNPVRLMPNSEPQPDVMLLKPRADDYRDSLPTPAEVLLLIEVSDTTVDDDRRVKVPMYAHHGIPEVWLVDLRAEVLEVYTAPGPQGYDRVRRLGKEDAATPGLVKVAALQLKEIWR